MKIDFNRDGFHYKYWCSLPEDVQRLIATDAVERALKLARPWNRPVKPWLKRLFKKCRKAQVSQEEFPDFNIKENLHFNYKLSKSVLCLTNASTDRTHTTLYLINSINGKHFPFRLNKRIPGPPSPYANQEIQYKRETRLFAAAEFARLAIYSDWLRDRKPTPRESQTKEKEFYDWFLFRTKWILEMKETRSPRFYHLIPEGVLEPPSGLDLLGNGHPKLFEY